MFKLQKFLFVLLGAFSLNSIAAPSSNNLVVQANIKSGCLINMENINLVDLKGLANDVLVPYNISVKCTKGTPFNIKTTVAQGIKSPINDTIFNYIYPMYHKTNPTSDYIGYRFLIVNPAYRFGSVIHFGDGSTNNRGVITSYLKSTGTGNLEKYDIEFRYWLLKYLEAGEYSATQNFTLEY